MTLLARAYLRAYRITAIGLAVLTALVVLAVPYLLTLNTQATQAWVSPWSSVAQLQSDWQTVGAPCYGITPGRLRLTCQSAGLVTRQTWSRQFPITVTAQVSASAASGNKYFVGLTIYDLTSGDTEYGEMALAERVPPFQAVSGPAAGVLVNDGLYWSTLVALGWHTLRVVYLPSGTYRLYLDGTLVQTVTPYRPLQHDPVIFVLCASVGEATPDDGSLARCDFGPVTVLGIRSENVAKTYLPSVTRRAMATPQAYP